MKFTVFAALGAVFSSVVGIPMASAEEIHLPGTDFYPEGIAVAPNGDFYVGSLARREIIRIDANTRKISTFAGGKDADLMSVIGTLVSRDGKTLFACSSDPSGRDAPRVPELVAFDIASGAVKGRYPFDGGGMCNDLAEAPNGTVLATDSFRPRIMRLRPGADALDVAISDADRFGGEGFALNGIVIEGGDVYFVKYNSGEFLVLDYDENGDRTLRTIALDRPLEAPDGLEFLGEGRFLVVEGVGRLATIDVKDGKGRVKTIAEGLDVPTTAAVRDGVAYVVQGQLDHFFGMDPGAPVPFRIKPVPLP